jgi:hypothetical protein
VVVVTHSWIYLRWLPRIVARRHAAERADDPRAGLRHRREIIGSRIGYAVGMLGGSAAVVYAALTLAQR